MARRGVLEEREGGAGAEWSYYFMQKFTKAIFQAICNEAQTLYL